MKPWKQTIQISAKIALCLCVFAATPHVSAAPEDDPLAQLLRQRQQAQQIKTPPTQQEPDREALERLIHNKTAEANAAEISRPAVSVPRFTLTAPAAKQPTPALSAPRVNFTENSSNASSGSASSEGNNRRDADTLIKSAMGFIGVAYRFGGTTPRGFDCSGFMQYVFRQAFAVNLPRTSAQQATVGSHVSRANLQAGDMVFFRTAGRRISHVGMYVGNDRFIHAPRTGKRIEVTSLSNRYWSARYATARRVKRNNAHNFIRS